jgi:DnaJ-class molecular chaperone
METEEKYPDYSIAKIIGIMDAFNFDGQINEKRVDFIQSIFRINIDPIETQFSKKKIAEIIQIRLEQDETCPECHGWGCSDCRGTGKKNIYK